jgi:hypothetical protein
VLDVEVYNLLGELVLPVARLNGNLQLDLGELPNGNYIVKITGENGVATRSVALSR